MYHIQRKVHFPKSTLGMIARITNKSQIELKIIISHFFSKYSSVSYPFMCVIIFQEAFSAAKLAFSSFKLKVRSNLVTTHVGPDTLEEHVQDYINRNTDLYDLAGLVSVSKTNCVKNTE